MAAQSVPDKVIETDVLVMGGGLGGCPAACKAAEHGLHVTIVEKAATERSGACAMGRDEIQPFTREGVTALELVRRMRDTRGEIGKLQDPNVLYQIVANSMWTLEELERLGISMRYLNGEYHWTNFMSFGTEAKLSLQVPWLNVKPEMAAAVRKRGVQVLDRTMVLDLLTDNGKVAGATAVNTRTGEFIVIKAKAVVIAAGKYLRHCNPSTPTWKYKMGYEMNPSSGDGQAAAYRAGSAISSMELMISDGYPDELCLRICHFNEEGLESKVFNSKGEEVEKRQIYRGPLEYLELERKGLVPFYRSLEDVPEDFHKRIEVAVVHERFVQLNFAQQRGFNPRTHRYQMSALKRTTNRDRALGINVDDTFKGTLPGVYALGDCAAGFWSGLAAITAGLLIGDTINKYVSMAGEPVADEAQVESQKQTALAPQRVKDGVEPLELEGAIRHISDEYAGVLKSEGRLREGLKRLGSLKREFLPRLMAPNPHYLMRCLEVRNIIDLAEVYFQACLARKETRGSYIRLDYPDKDPSMDNKRICQRMEKGKAVLELEDMPALKPEYALEEKK